MVQVVKQPTQDQRIVQPERTWEQFKLIQQGFDNSPGVRLFYYNGTLEILVPGRDHERFSAVIALLLGIFLIEKGIEFEPTGSMDQEKPGEAFVQADQSYCFDSSNSLPDLSIEVVLTSGGINKLARYRALGIPEVWFWEDGVFSLYHLREDGYEQIDRSELPALVDLDLNLLTQCVLMAQTSRLEAAKLFRQGIQLGPDKIISI
ncbi:MAG TPA: Uma2 family endonuclease [Leptolyngbyaceae cyanobacterium M65_K2018_010]|nr:Uma2 family endonuclease [Leptolyngbyaceae cyanobacterium M65_K2018_010]